jgi:ABC-2 type transport system permease protein
MSPRRVAVLLGKEIAHGSKSFIFVLAILAPLVISLVLTLVFGNLFSEKPKLGITDEGDSQVVGLALELDSIVTRVFASSSELTTAVQTGAVDMGIVLPGGFDSSVTEGTLTPVTAYVWGESLAKNRAILEATIAGLTREVIGHQAPVDIATTTLGDAENIPWQDRLLPFIVLLAVIFGGSMIPATSLVDEKQKHTLVALTTTPVTLEDVYLAKGLIGIIISFFMGVLTLILNQALSSNPSLLFLVLGLGAVLAATYGVLLGAFAKDITSLFATIKAMGLLLYAPAIVYLFPQIPEWIGKVFPTYYIIQPVVEITQQGGTWSDVALEVLVLVGLIVVSIGAVLVVARKTKQHP